MPPVPQAPRPLSSDTNGPITPGKGARDAQTGANSSSNSQAQQQPEPSSQAPASQGEDRVQTAPPEMPAAGEGVDKAATIIRLHVNFVEIPVTVKDSKGKMVAGLTFRDFKVYENNTREPLAFFTTDSFPLSIAFVIDQSLTSDVMAKVNNSLGAIQGALTPYDEVAVFSYNNGAQNRSGGFTGAQKCAASLRALDDQGDWARDAGADQRRPICQLQHPPERQLRRPQPAGWRIGRRQRRLDTDSQGDSHPQRRRPGRRQRMSTRPKGRRRIIYVISDGKEYGSKASL